MIEARWLFDVEMSRVDVIVHPQSIVHSMVEFVDGSVLGAVVAFGHVFPDPVCRDLARPGRQYAASLDFATLAKLEFEAPRYDDFPALDLARRAGETGGTLPSVMNAANEVAVDAFSTANSPSPASGKPSKRSWTRTSPLRTRRLML